MEKSKTLSKKLISLVLSLLMVLSCFSGMGLTAFAASTTVTWNPSDIVPEHPWDKSFTKDGITITAATCDFELLTFGGGGTFTTTLGNFTKIEISADYAGDVSGTGWSNDGWQSATWTGDAASVSFSGDIWGGGMTCDGGNLTIVFTIATVPVTGVTLDKTDAQTIDVGGKVAFTATVAPDGATDKTVKWSVGGTNASAVTLYSDSNCTQAIGADATSTLTVYAKGISAGSATVTATSNADGSKSASCAVTVSAPATAYAGYVPAEADDADALAAKVVKFNGYDWYLIEDNSTSATEGTVTLFAKDKIGSSRFDNSSNVYSGSMVKSYLDNLTAEGGAFADVADAIASTDLEDVTVTGAKLWLLSKDEVITTYKLSTALNKCSNDWWLRTPVTSSYVIYVNGESGSVVNTGNFHMNTYGVRPALKLDLSKVEFNSETKTFAVKPTVIEYRLWVGDVQVTSANMDDVLGDKDSGATVTFTPAATGENPTPATLTLKGATVTDYFAGVSVRYGINDTLVINLEGDNTIGSDSDDGLYTGLETRGSLIIQGNGKLAVKGRYNGIMSDGDITIESGEITASALNSGIQSGNENEITLNGGKVTAKGNTGIVGYDGVTIEGADVNAEGKNYAIFTADKDITISAGTVNATATGADTWQKALNGTVKNSIYGTGWTDSAGTEGKTAIATSTTGQDLSDYKKVIFISHIHDFSYSTGYNAIIAECTADGCTLDDGTEQHNHIITLNIVAPTLTTYGQTGEGISAEATLDGLDAFNAATGLNVSATDIKYYESEESFPGYTRPGEELEGAPTDAGTYFAGITLSNVKINETDTSNVSAYVSYTIAKADPTCTAPTGLTATYGQTLADVMLTNPSGNTAGTWAWSDSRTSVGNAGTNTFKASFVPTDTTNYNTKTNIDVSVTVGKADPTYTVPTGLEATYGDTLSSVTLPTGWSWANGSQKVGNADTKTFKATYTPADTDNYNVVNNIDVTVTVNKADINPTVSITGWTYGQAANSPSVSGNTGDGHVKYTYAVKGSDEFSETVPTDANTYTVKAAIAATTNYNGKTVTADFTIAKADPTFTTTVTITPSDYKSGDTITKDGVTVATHIYTNPNGMTLMNGGTITSSVGNITNIEVTAQNSPSGEGWSNGTWTGDSSSVSFSNTVYYFTQIECTIEANAYPEDLTATYGDTLADVDLPDGWAWVDDTQSVGDAGTKTFKANFTPEDTDNYNVLENLDVTVTVDKAAINPTVTLEGWTYGETANEPSVTGNAGESEVTYTYATKGSDSFSDAVPTDAGEYTVKATIAATDNYKAGTATADFMVAKADIAPTVSIEGWTYGEEANKPVLEGNTGNGEVTYLYKEKGASDMSCTDVVPTQAGEYTVKALIAATANYNGANAEADFTIAKAKVTITADDKSSKREANLKKLTYKVDGKIYDGDDLGIKVSSNVKAAVAGKYVIKVAYTANANYDVTVVNGTYTVTDRITAKERTAGKNKINSAIKATVNKNGSVTAKWGAVANADKFEIYANYCSKDNKFKKIKTVKGSVHSFDITKLNGKKLDQKKSVKIYVVAYRKVNGKYEKITQSVQLHVVNQSKNYSNAKAITVKKDAFTLKVNKTATIKPTLVLQDSKKKKGVEHVAKFRYQSTNTAVATVDANGKITAVGKGTCWVYIFANNGKLKSVKVTVK